MKIVIEYVIIKCWVWWLRLFSLSSEERERLYTNAHKNISRKTRLFCSVHIDADSAGL